MFGTTQDTEEENLIILGDDTDFSETQTMISPLSPIDESNTNTVTEFSIDLGDGVEQKNETSSVEEIKNEETKSEVQDFSLDFSNSGTSEIVEPVSNPVVTDSFSFGEVAPTSNEIVSDADDMVTILSGTISKLKGRQTIIDETKSKKISEVDELNKKINDLKVEVSTLKDEISSLESENNQIEKNVQALESMKGTTSTNTKVHTIKRTANTKKV